jgi:hypothetical protein
MQLDFQQFIVQLDKFITIKPIPGKEGVENFIKAYYLTEVSFLQIYSVTDRFTHSMFQMKV